MDRWKEGRESPVTLKERRDEGASRNRWSATRNSGAAASRHGRRGRCWWNGTAGTRDAG